MKLRLFHADGQTDRPREANTLFSPVLRTQFCCRFGIFRFFYYKDMFTDDSAFVSVHKPADY